MKQANKTSLVAYLFALALIGVVTGCEKEVYNPDNGKTKPLPPAENYFNFELRGKVQLSVDYHAPGFQAIIEVYDQDPMSEENPQVKKEGVQSIYSAYTDQNGKFNGTMIVPVVLKEAYLYTDAWGLPQCVKLKLSEQGAAYDSETDVISRPTTRGGNPVNGLSGTFAPYRYFRTDGVWDQNLYSLCIWNSWFEFSAPANYLLNAESVLGAGIAGPLADRSQKYFTEVSKKSEGHTLLGQPGETNVATKEDGTELQVTFLVERAAQRNTFGYYYYKKGQRPTDMSQVKKYIIAPDASLDGYAGFSATAKQAVQLKFFGDSGIEPGVNQFPAGYEIAWFYIRNAASSSLTGYDQNEYGTLQNIAYSGPLANFCTSNDTGDNRRFVLLKDSKTGLLVLGFEDSKNVAANDDYSDLLFVVKSNKDVDGSTGEIPDEDTGKEPGVLLQEGTLAFEDIWPAGGDYDLNDVIIEYTRKVTYNTDNKVTKISETFTPVQPDGSATYDNFFACQVKNMGTPTLDAGMIKETATGSFVITGSAKSVKGKSFTVTRSFATALDKNTVLEDFNPYIIAKAYTDANRIEVHLPKHDMTSAADASKMNQDNAYYIAAGGIYPFAIDIPVKGFIPATETYRIDAEGQYPAFANWAKSKGASDSDWYLKGKGSK